MDRQQISAANQLFAAVRTLDLKLPKQVAEALEQVDAVRAAVKLIPPHDRQGTARAVADALIQGADPLTDPDVARAITHAAITQPGVIDHIETAAFMRLWDAVNAHSDDMVAAMRKPFDKAADVLVAAHESIGNLDLKADSEDILKKGGDIAKVWAGAVEASETIDTVILAWAMLGRFINTSPTDARWLNLRLINTTAHKFDDLDLSRKTLTPYDAVRLGVPLTLPTLSEYAGRRAAIVEQRQKIERDRENQRRNQGDNSHNLFIGRVR